VFSQINIRGRILLTDNQPLEAAFVSVIDSSTMIMKSVLSDMDGKFEMKDLPAGKYVLNASFLGFEPLSVPVPETGGNVNLGNLTLASNAINIQELVVEGKRVIQKTDNETYLPTQFQKQIANNGIELLSALAIRGVYVNPVDLTVQKINGGVIQLRINNVRADLMRIMSLRPEKILRVEYYDSPTAAYGGEGVEAVINYVTVHAETGGYVYTDLSNAVTTGLSNNSLSAAFNTKSSEFELTWFLGYRNYSQTRDDGTDWFYKSDGTKYERTQQGIDRPYNYTQHLVTANYQLQPDNRSVFNVAFKTEFLPQHSDNRAGYETNSLNNHVLFTERKASNPYNRPVLDIYYHRKIKNNQELVFNWVGTLWNEENKTCFSQNENDKPLINYQVFVNGKKRSAIFEGIYSNQLSENGKLSAGVRHLQAHSNNIYSGSSHAETNMNQANTYLFSEFASQIEKFGFSISAGLSRSSFSETNKRFDYYNFRPSVSLKYAINDNHTVTNRFRVLNSNPSLSQLSDVELFMDSIKISKGNPDLKPYHYYTNALAYNFNKKKISFSTELNYQYLKNPIMESFYYDSEKLIQTDKNQKNWKQFKVESQVTVGTLWNILRFSAGGGILSQHSNGHEYNHQLTSGYAFANISAFYKNFSFSGNFKTKTKSLYGESYSYYAPDVTMQLQYVKNNRWVIGINTWNPFFSALKNQFEVKSAHTGQFRTITYRDNGNVFSIRFAYVFSFGREYNTSRKQLDNSDTESGIMKK
jgi:hypothetical protein